MNVFARFEGEISPGGAVVVPISLTTGNATLKNGSASFAFVLSAAAGSTLDAGSVTVRDGKNRDIGATFFRPDIGGTEALTSLTHVDLRTGQYTLTLRGDHATGGAFNLDVLLLGDVNGDRQVNSADTAALNAAYGSTAGQPGYSPAADADRDGIITAFDRAAVARNQGDRVRINPLALTVAATPAGSVIDGITYTNTTKPRLRGLTNTVAKVRFDTDGDGYDDGVASSSATTGYSTAVKVPVGASTVRVRAVDTFGQVRTTEIRLLVDTTPPPVPVWTLAPESDSAPLGDNATTYRFVNLNGSGTEPGVRLDTGPNTRSFTANPDGTFRITDLALEPGSRMVTVRAIDLAGNIAVFSRKLTRSVPNDTASPAFVWNSAMLEAGRLNGDSPPQISRAFAMVSAAMYDALNAVNGASSYLFARVTAPAFASAPAALIAAARRVMDYLYAPQAASIAATFNSTLSAIPAGQSREDGIAVGYAVADLIIAQRRADGSTDYTEYFPSTAPGLWQPTAPMFAPALLPNWATLTPFSMTSPDQFLPQGPMALTSAQYTAEYNEVRSIGAANSTTRTADQTAMARFWADGAGTYTPAGHWNQIATSIAQSQNLSLFDTARLMAQLNVALADAAIVAWNAKYTYNQWRPITAIRNADLDGNPDTEQDRGWMPLVNTPPFPDYLSGHSTFSGAAERILSDTFGSNFSFTSRAFSLPGDAPGALRSFTSFTHAANEASASRIYGGIHFRESCEVGLVAGRALGDHVLARFSDLSDHTAPVVTVTSPGGNERVRNASFSIEGRVVDGISAVTLAEAQLDDGPWQPLTLTNRPPTNGSGDFAYAVSVGGAGGLAQGEHTLRLRATDSSGNRGEPLVFSFTIDTAAPVLSVTTPEDGGTLDPADPRLTGMVAGTGSAIAELCYRLNDGPEITMIFDAAGAAAGEGSFDERIRLGDLGPGTHTLTIRARDAAGNETTVSRMFALDAAAPLTVMALSPVEGAGEIGVTQRPRIDFSRPVDPASLTSSNLFLSFSGQVVPTRIVPGADGTFAWLFPTQAMPGASVITMTIRGGDSQNPGIRTSDGELLDGDGDGEAGGTRTLTFTTVSTAPIPGTTVTDAQGNQTIIATTLTGIVADPGPDLSPGGRDDVLVGPDGVLMTLDDVYTRPLVGVEVYILGREHERVFTDVNGRFTLTNVPSGSVKVIVNGLTATAIGTGPNAGPLPGGVYFPEMTMDVICVPGVTNYVMSGMRDAMGHADSARVQGVYLPRIETAILQAVSATEPTVVTIQDAASRNLTPAQRENLMIEVQPGSLVDEQGNPIASGQVGISTVPAELVRDMLPPGVLEHTFDITVQARSADGSQVAAAFTRPATLTFPNVFNAAPGTKLNFLSFDHTTGRLVIEGTATVSADGTKVVTDAGTGITKPGWHGLTPPGNPLMPPCNPDILNYRVVRDLGNAAVACAEAVLGPLGALVRNLNAILDSLFTLQNNLEQIRNDIARGRDRSEACHAINLLEPGFRALTMVLTNTLGRGSPIGRARDAVNCISALLAVANSACRTIERHEECRTVLITTLCTGVEVAYDTMRLLNALIQEAEGAQGRAAVAFARVGFDALKLAICGPGLDPVPDEEILLLLDAANSALRDVSSELLVVAQPATAFTDSMPQVQQVASVAQEVVESHIIPTYAFYKMELRRPLWSGSNLLTYGVAINGQGYPQWVQPNEGIEILAYDPETRRMAHVVMGGGSRFIPPLVFQTTSHLPDTDQDGIPDFVETELLRSNPNNPDTDGDGISDEIEAIDGFGPFVDQRSTMGTSAMVELQGEALDVVLYSPGSQNRNSGISTPASPRALVATGSHGVALVGIANPTRPRLLSELSLPGTSSAIAVDELLGLAAVASGNGGLHIVSAGPDGTLSLERSIPVNTTAIAIADGVVYAGVGARLRGYDLLTGEQMLDRALPAPLRQIAVEGSVLYGLSTGGTTLTAFSLAVPTVPILSSLSLPQAAAGKLFVGGGTAYIGIGDGAILTGGFISVNIANPQSMQVISGADDLALAGAMVVPNGSGRAVGVGQLVYADTSIVQNRLDVYNTSDLSNTGLLERGILLNARPAAVAISAGLAYVACGPSGLRIVGFLETDTNRVRPVVTADPQSVDVDPIRPGIQVVEGSLLAVPVTISDDVQVRQTEVLLNYAGNVSTVRTDTTFPFDMRVRLPRIADGSNIATLIYRARDTGGNAGNVFVDVELVEDAVRPTLSGISPEEGAAKGPSFRTVSLSFSETVAPETLTSSAIMLRRSDETLIEPIAIQPRFNGRTVVLTYPQLELGVYTVEVDPSLISDLAGNTLEGEGVILRSFEITEFSNIFIGPSGGSWSDPVNWSRGVIPDEDDSVLIDLPGNGTVIATNITATIVRLTVRDTLVLQNVTINGEVVNRGLIEVRDASGGANRSVLNAGLTNAAGATLLVQAVNGTGGTANLTIDGALTNHGTIELSSANPGGGSTLTVTNDTLTNTPTGLITTTGPAGTATRTITAAIDNQGTIETTINPLTINGGAGISTNSGAVRLIGGNLTWDRTGAGSLTNTGTIEANPGRSLTLNGGVVHLSNANEIAPDTLTFSDLTLNLAVDWSSGSPLTQLIRSTIHGPGRYSNPVGRTLQSRGSTWNTQINNDGLLDVNDSTGGSVPVNTFNAALTNSGRLLLQTISGNFSSAGMVVNATLTNSGLIDLSTNQTTLGLFLTVNSGTLVNLPTGTISTIGPANSTARTITATLDNQGTIETTINPLTINGGAGASTNSGTVRLIGGGLTWNHTGAGSLTNTDTFDIGAGRTLAFSGGTLHQNTDAPVGDGAVTFSGMTVNLGSDWNTTAAFTQATDTTFHGPGLFFNAAGRHVLLYNGTINAAVQNSGLIEVRDISGANRSFLNAGVTNASGATLLVRAVNAFSAAANLTIDGTLTNHGTIQLSGNDPTWFGTLTVNSGTLTNTPTGLITTTGPAGTTARSITAAIDNQGTIETTINPLTINGGAGGLSNTGTIRLTQANLTVATGAVVNHGLLVVSPNRILTISSTFTNSATGTIQIDISGPNTTDRGRINISGTATLDGTFRANFINGYEPAAGVTFTNLLTFASSTGTFSLIDATNLPGGRSLIGRYNAGNFSLEVA